MESFPPFDAYPTFPTPTELMVQLSVPHAPAPMPVPVRTTPSFVSSSDSISSHEKKRHYLECIEQYIQFLHQQFDLLGERPPEMERVASYRGLSSRSIRVGRYRLCDACADA
jgi:hypothetical protein